MNEDENLVGATSPLRRLYRAVTRFFERMLMEGAIQQSLARAGVTILVQDRFGRMHEIRLHPSNTRI